MVHAGVAHGLLRRHVRRRAQRNARRGESSLGARGRGERLRDAEVGQSRRVTDEEHVVRLDVAVHDAALVRECECARHVPQDAERLDQPGVGGVG